MGLPETMIVKQRSIVERLNDTLNECIAESRAIYGAPPRQPTTGVIMPEDEEQPMVQVPAHLWSQLISDASRAAGFLTLRDAIEEP